jgi:hypothetical protein
MPMSEVIHALARRDVSFGPEDIAVLAAGFESALINLHITNVTIRRRPRSPS